MSTGANCGFHEESPGQWFYRIQQYPYGRTEDYDRHGPFPTFEHARKHLYRHYANPGGFWIEAQPGCPHDLLSPEGPFKDWDGRVTHDCHRCGGEVDLTPPPVYGASAT